MPVAEYAGPDAQTKVPLATFLKHLTGVGIPMVDAMGVAGKVYKTYSTPAALSTLSNTTLERLGVEKELRTKILAAVKKAGWKPPAKSTAVLSATPGAGPSSVGKLFSMMVEMLTDNDTGAKYVISV